MCRLYDPLIDPHVRSFEGVGNDVSQGEQLQHHLI